MIKIFDNIMENKKDKYLRKGMIPHINKKEHYINPSAIAGLGGGFIVTRNQQEINGEQQYFPSEKIIDSVFEKK